MVNITASEARSTPMLTYIGSRGACPPIMTVLSASTPYVSGLEWLIHNSHCGTFDSKKSAPFRKKIGRLMNVWTRPNPSKLFTRLENVRPTVFRSMIGNACTKTERSVYAPIRKADGKTITLCSIASVLTPNIFPRKMDPAFRGNNYHFLN